MFHRRARLKRLRISESPEEFTPVGWFIEKADHKANEKRNDASISDRGVETKIAFMGCGVNLALRGGNLIYGYLSRSDTE